jgi:CYTH domain-containing protein
MEEIEIERTFLVKTLPADLQDHPHKVLFDIYLPSESRHPNLRLRQKGDSYEMTKKLFIDENDHSEQKELTIPLTKEEFDELATIKGKRVKKLRYYYPYKGITAEIDVFQDDLAGLVVADFEFTSTQEKNAFTIPDWCLVDVTHEEFIAGGMLCGKSYVDIEEELEKINYNKILDKPE